METINYGIDLGTTNSLIAKFVKGEIEIFQHPVSWKETLPSVVGFRKDTYLIGEKAKQYLLKDSKNVFSRFKRRMGTNEIFKTKFLNQSLTPVDLSAYVLKELKTMVHSGEVIEDIVITVPASFDTVQCIATEEAGKLAGFIQVLLLQEPIAASLAFANKKKEKKLSDCKWIVYDLGGGTFDVALVCEKDGELNVLDNQGDNFLGGADFDEQIVKQIIIPKLEKEGHFENLLKDMTSSSGKYNTKWLDALRKAEESKIELSARTYSEIEIDILDDDENEINVLIRITRSDLENIITNYVDKTVQLVRTIITRNSLVPSDIEFVLMVGGSTYIPFVRKRVEEALGIKINCDINPTTAIVIGAAYYAGTKKRELIKIETTEKKSKINIKTAYNATTDDSVFFSAKIDGVIKNLHYRITRDDGGYNSGIKPLNNFINEDLLLIKDSFNYFTLNIYDDRNNLVKAEPIEIAQGYRPRGQTLPEDISLVIDDTQVIEDINLTEDIVAITKLDPIFLKNDILPLQKLKHKTTTTQIRKGSEDYICIRVVEGPHDTRPEANKLVGQIIIKGKEISKDLPKGSDIELTFEFSESRTLKVSAYIAMTGQEFKDTFIPKKRIVTIGFIKEDSERLLDETIEDIKEAEDNEEYEVAGGLNELKKQLKKLLLDCESIPEDDVTDNRYQLEDEKRKIAQSIGSLTLNKYLLKARQDYIEEKKGCQKTVSEHGNDYEINRLKEIEKLEESFLNSNNPMKIREMTDELHYLALDIIWRIPSYLQDMFRRLVTIRERFNDQFEAKSLIMKGNNAIENQDDDKLKDVISRLIDLLPKSDSNDIQRKTIMGIE